MNATYLLLGWNEVVGTNYRHHIPFTRRQIIFVLNFTADEIDDEDECDGSFCH